MNIGYVPSLSTIIFISFFIIIYISILIRNAIKNHIDFYDLIMLSMVALVPAIFVFFPSLTLYIAKIIGVEFPFLLLFGGLFFILFIYQYRLITKVNFLHKRNILLVQEIGLLNQKLSSMSEVTDMYN